MPQFLHHHQRWKMVYRLSSFTISGGVSREQVGGRVTTFNHSPHLWISDGASWVGSEEEKSLKHRRKSWLEVVSDSPVKGKIPPSSWVIPPTNPSINRKASYSDEEVPTLLKAIRGGISYNAEKEKEHQGN